MDGTSDKADRTAAAAGIGAWVLYTNVPVAAIAVCFVLGTYALLGLSPSGPLLVLAFCGTFLVY